MIEENYQHIDYTSARDILTAVFKHKYKILVAFLVIFAAALAFASQVRETYEAKSVLLIKLGREFSNQSLAGGPTQPGNSTLPLDAVTKGEISILTGHDLSKKVVGALGPVTLYPELSTMTKGADLEGVRHGRVRERPLGDDDRFQPGRDQVRKRQSQRLWHRR